MKTAIRVIAVALAMRLAGCAATSGSRYDRSAIQRIKPGVTTESELEAWFGVPYQHEDLGKGREKIVWQYTRVGVGVGIEEQHELFVTMRADRRVESFEERNK